MALDERRRVSIDGHGLDYVGVKRALRQKLRLARALACGLEDLDEGFADDFAFALGIGYAAQLFQEERRSVLVLELDVKVAAEDLLHDFRFAGAEQPVVDENAGELVADGLVQERGGEARIHAARQAEQDALRADLGADGLDGLVDVAAHGPFLPAAADAVDKVAEDFLAARRVRDFGMKLDAEEFLGPVFDGGVGGILRDGHRLEAVRQLRELVAVGIPNLHLRGQSLEQSAGRVFDGESPFAELPLQAFPALPAEQMSQQLLAVTEAQHRHPQAEE